MIKQIRHNFLTRYFWCFMSLYLLNCFVDSPDVQPDYFTEDLTYNDQESIIEIFVEKVLGFENAIAEYDDNDINQSSSLKSNFSIDFFVLPIITLSGNKNYMRLKKENLAVQNSILLTPYFKIHTPPPEA